MCSGCAHVCAGVYQEGIQVVYVMCAWLHAVRNVSCSQCMHRVICSSIEAIDNVRAGLHASA